MNQLQEHDAFASEKAAARDDCKAQLRMLKAEYDATKAEKDRLWREMEKRRGPAFKKKSGRPSIWLGLEGLFLVSVVEWILAENAEQAGRRDEEGNVIKRITVSLAIRRAILTNPALKEKFGHLLAKPRTLQARYQMAANCFSDFRMGPLREEYEAAERRLVEVVKRCNALLDTLNALGG